MNFGGTRVTRGYGHRFLAILLFLFIVWPLPLRAAYTGPVPEGLLKLTSGFAVFVDKKEQKVYVFQSRDGGLDKVFEAPCSTGKVRGAKLAEGDAKTPNGIFFATRFATVPDATSTYGSMVYYLDYPNLFDRRAGRNGDNIWIHGTNKPLQPNQSNGCVTLRNPDIENLSRYIYIGETPIIIEESVKWVAQKESRPDGEELERLARRWTKTMIDGDWTANNGLYLQEGIEPLPQRKGMIQKAAQLKTAKWHFDVMPRDMTICKLDYTAVVLFDQTLSLKNPDNVQGSYVKLYLEKNTAGWFIVENVKPVAIARKEPAVPAGQGTTAAKQAETTTGRKDGSSAALARAPSPSREREEKKADREIAQLVERWASSWEKGRMGHYGACYAPNFRSQGKDLKAWVAYKQDLGKRYKNIRVRAENLKVTVQGERATAVFKQHYSASNLKSSGMKKFDLVRVGGDWKIARETISR